MAQVTVVFLDQVAQNPLPAGLTVSIYPHGASQIPGNLVASGTLSDSGTCSLSLAFSTQYDAYFAGVGAPAYPYTFSLGSGQFVVGPFAQISDQQNTSSGYLGLVSASGTKTLLQWDEVTVTTDASGRGSILVTFPEAFPTGVLRIFTGIDNGAADDNTAESAKAVARTKTGFTMSVSGAPNSSVTAEYLAIGY